MARFNFFSKRLTRPKTSSKPVYKRIFSRPQTVGDLVKQALWFVLYFWPSIYFTVIGTSLE